MRPLFETSRLFIQPIDLAQDLDTLFALHNHLNTMRWIPNNKSPWTEEDIRQKYHRNQVLYPMQLGLHKIVLKHQNPPVLIGELGLFPCIDSPISIEIGYILHENFWKQGLGTNLLEALHTFVQRHLTYTILRAQLFETNIASKKLLERCGYQYERAEAVPGIHQKLIYSKHIIR